MNSNFNIPDLENLYPEIYKELYPLVVSGVREMMRAGRITIESIERVTDDIIIKSGLWDEDGDNLIGFNPWLGNAETAVDNAEIFNDAEFVMARPQPQRPPQNRPPQNRPPQRPPQRPSRPGICVGRGCHNRNTLRDLLKILILREIIDV